jgi:hypothetical protein
VAEREIESGDYLHLVGREKNILRAGKGCSMTAPVKLSPEAERRVNAIASECVIEQLHAATSNIDPTDYQRINERNGYCISEAIHAALRDPEILADIRAIGQKG